jgi:4-hydroxybutyrate CoA-transferase
VSLHREWESRAVSPDQVVARMQSGTSAFIHGAAATPTPLLEALCARGNLEQVRLYHLHLEGPLPFTDAALSERFHSVSLFTGPGLRQPVAEGRADYVPVFLSDIPELFTSRNIPLDVALVQLSPPDVHGYCTLGTSVDAARAAVDSAGIVLAEINRQMPRTYGNTVVPLERVTAYTITDHPLHIHPTPPEDEVSSRIGELVAGLVEDGATLQMGIGAIPNAVLARLGNKHDLGVHTEMFSDFLVDLVHAGVVTNRQKKIYPGQIVTSFLTGSQRLFDFVDDNPLVSFHGCDVTNSTAVIRKNAKVTAINSALQVDLTGQICADSFGHRIYSGIGGQMDFMRGAAESPGGKPIIAMPSMAGGGKFSRIVLELTPGAGVVTTRGHVHWIVTEYGAVNLHGRTLRERAEMLIGIAHPDIRAELRREVARLRHFPMPAS